MDHFSFLRRDDLQLLVCHPLEKIGFKNAFSTRLGGVSPLPRGSLSLGNFNQDERANVMENRRRFLSALRASDWSLVTAKQVHSAAVRSICDAEDARSEPTSCDALSADIKLTLLAVQTADCMPILIADERTGAFAAIHAGWRGTLAGIVARTIEEMQLRYDSRPEDLHAGLGPAIGACCFEVGPEVIAQFREKYGYTDRLISGLQRSGKGRLDLHRANKQQLIDYGLRDGKIYDCGLCTVCRNDLFFSYRHERGDQKPVGRLMGVIGRES
jgi:YfiH family protein